MGNGREGGREFPILVVAVERMLLPPTLVLSGHAASLIPY